ncbi:nucleic acid/nucleotide deaminase domain-containing protein [Nocardia yunnanensis]|nr:nucleic acid/nucleotide deaminase domain-containing protein [Nocardia yunnanensis]
MLGGILSALVIAAGCATSVSGHPVAGPNTAPFYAAVVDLMSQSAAHYTGSSAQGGAWDVRATAGGEVVAKAGSGADSTDVLVVDGKTYAKPPKSKIAANLPRGATLSSVQGKWLTGDDDLTTGIPSGALSPHELAKQLLQALDRTTAFPRVGDPTVQIGSDQAYEVPTPIGTLAVSSTAPYRVLRLSPPDGTGPTTTTQSLDAPGGILGGQGDQAAPIMFVAMTPADREQVYNDIVNQTQTLSNSMDVGINFQFDPSGDLNCTEAACTVTSKVTTSTTATRKATLSGNVSAVMKASLTVEGRPSAGCSTAQTLPISGNSVMSCVDTSVAAITSDIRAAKRAEAQAKANAEGHDVYLNWDVHVSAQIEVTATAMIQAEIDRMVTVVRTEADNARNRSTCGQTCTYTQTPYNSDKLGQAANRARHTGAGSNGNIMVALVPGWNDPTTGDLVTGTGDSQPDNATGKSEDDLVNKLSAKGFKPDQITGLYSEHQPCFSTCNSKLAPNLKPGTQVGYSVSWLPNDADALAASNSLIDRLSSEYGGAQHK